MKLWFVLLILLGILSLRPCRGCSLRNALSIETTTRVKGFLTGAILIAHANVCYGMPKMATTYRSHIFLLGQIVMPLFFLYMGYALAESVSRKPGYASRIPQKRILRLYLHYLVAAAIGLPLALVSGGSYTPMQYLSMLTAWGVPYLAQNQNMCWFVFVTIFLYFFAYLSYLFFKKPVQGHMMLTVFSTLLAVSLYLIKPPVEHLWWDTIFLFPVGLWLSYFFPRLEALHRRLRPVFRAVLLAAAAALTIVTNDHYQETAHFFSFLIAQFFLAVSALLLFARVRLTGGLLSFLGRHSFEIYVSQFAVVRLLRATLNQGTSFIKRFPSLKFLFTENAEPRPYPYTLLFILLSVGLGSLLSLLFKKIDPLLFERKQSKTSSQAKTDAESAAKETFHAIT